MSENMYVWRLLAVLVALGLCPLSAFCEGFGPYSAPGAQKAAPTPEPNSKPAPKSKPSVERKSSRTRIPGLCGEAVYMAGGDGDFATGYCLMHGDYSEKYWRCIINALRRSGKRGTSNDDVFKVIGVAGGFGNCMVLQ